MPHAPAIVLTLALHGAAWAGPVPAAEADAAPAAATLPNLPSPGLTQDAAASAPSRSALAVEIITEAEVGAAAAEAPRSSKRDGDRAAAVPTAPSPAARKQADSNDDPWGLREMGKTAVQWIKDAVPWRRSDKHVHDAGRAVALDTADWSASPQEGGAARGARPGTAHLPATAGAADPLSTVGYGNTPRPTFVGPEQNLVGVVINVLREVLEHPMTWLVVSLFVIGGIVVKKIDRRPTK